jgi:hypothetical protein
MPLAGDPGIRSRPASGAASGQGQERRISVDSGAGSRQDRIRPHALRDYALLAGRERGAVVGPQGEIVWMCAPRWDSDAVFAALAGGEAAYTVTPRSAVRCRAGQPALAVTRVLGVRHLIQAAATAAAPNAVVLTIGAQVDLAHAASMLALAPPPAGRCAVPGSRTG